MADCDRLFVYGTLRHGSDQPLALRLQQEAVHLGPARWRGRLYSLGPYPAAVRAAGHHMIVGDLYRLDPHGPLLPELDAYEGYDPQDPRPDGYVREADQVVQDGVGPAPAWVYTYTGPVSRSAWIPSGDWLADGVARTPPPE